MEKIKRFIECLIPITGCNLKCGYCYVIQRNKRSLQSAVMKYSPEQIGLAMNKMRWGGTCYFSICGAGETILQKDIEEIVFNILKNGHYVNITTNGTITNQLNKILDKSLSFINHLHFSFSFHYLELLDKNLLDVFFDNVKKCKEKGASIMVQVNMCDEYLPYLEDMKNLCIKNIGAMPQIAATRKEMSGLQKIELLTSHTEQEYKMFGKSFNSPLFDFTMKNFNVKRKEFCYAGDWSGNLNLATGIFRRCYASCIHQDIFKNPKEKINFLAVGNHCGSSFCMNSSHFMSLGTIPSLQAPTYAHLRNRKESGWYTKEMENFLSGKLKDNNNEYSSFKKIICNSVGLIDNLIYFIYVRIKKNRRKNAY
ncbi:MAG: radical SAM protein [Endomicrobiaceae bacterium]|jgi:organic radical activating enzyme|nr:radical SAM protein [Endomicrobiaceae bacterium]MDD4165604.1 radical SAM protein [Endomicrobiaceae bacterium]